MLDVDREQLGGFLFSCQVLRVLAKLWLFHQPCTSHFLGREMHLLLSSTTPLLALVRLLRCNHKRRCTSSQMRQGLPAQVSCFAPHRSSRSTAVEHRPLLC